METIEFFLDFTHRTLKHASERERAAVLLERWATAWQGKQRNVTDAFSNHGAYLHFHQLIDGTWCTVFSFHSAHHHGLSMRGPDPDRGRKSHKLRRHRLNTTGLDALFEAWSAHPEARSAGLAVEFYLDETPDDVWEACLQEALQHMGS